MKRQFRNQRNRFTTRDAHVNPEDVYNIYRDAAKIYRKHGEEKASVRMWIQELRTKENFSKYLPHHHINSWSFGFVSPWQRPLHRSATAFCLDATHNTANVDNALLYTMVIRHSDTHTGYPVAYLFTKDQSSQVLCDWLTFLESMWPRQSWKSVNRLQQCTVGYHEW